MPKLDDILGGGFPRGAQILIVGPPGSGKTTFCEQFIFEGLKNDQPVVYMSTTDPLPVILERASFFGWDFKKPLLYYVDAYSCQVGETSRAKFAVSDITDLTYTSRGVSYQLLSAVEEAGKKGFLRVVVDSISTLLFHNDEREVVKFCNFVTKKLKAMGYTAIYTLEKGAHPESTEKSIESLMDGIIEFEVKEDKRFIVIRKMTGVRSVAPLEFEITVRGVVGGPPVEMPVKEEVLSRLEKGIMTGDLAITSIVLEKAIRAGVRWEELAELLINVADRINEEYSKFVWLFSREEAYRKAIPKVNALKKACEILSKHIAPVGIRIAVASTVQHDPLKKLVSAILMLHGYDTLDLGVRKDPRTLLKRLKRVMPKAFALCCISPLRDPVASEFTYLARRDSLSEKIVILLIGSDRKPSEAASFVLEELERG